MDFILDHKSFFLGVILGQLIVAAITVGPVFILGIIAAILLLAAEIADQP